MDLTDKYYHYRQRFFSRFIAYDHYDKPGSNLPAAHRQLWGKGTKFICWGDTTITMAYYMMYLAYEYINFKLDNKEKDSKETLKKLYYALKTFERLDYTAEYNYKKLNIWITESEPNKERDLNGFFIRNDVPADMLIRYPHLKLKDEYDIVDKVEGFWSSHMLWNGVHDYKGADMSQDQVWHLLQGFAVVKKLFEKEGSLNYKIEKEEFNIVKLCEDNVKRVLDYMIITCNLNIQNPVFKCDVPRGADMRLFAYGFAKAGQEITGYDYTKHLKWHSKILYKFIIWFAEKIFYNGLHKVIGKLFKKHIKVKNYSYRSLAVVSNDSFGIDLHKMFNNDALIGEYLHFPYVYKLLHNKEINEGVHKIALDRLNFAPEDGPFNFGKNDRSFNIRWTSGNTLTESMKAEELGDNVAHLGVYNGLDFLLLYNLYKYETRTDK